MKRSYLIGSSVLVVILALIATGCAVPLSTDAEEPAEIVQEAVAAPKVAAVQAEEPAAAALPGEWYLELDGISSASIKGEDLVTAENTLAHPAVIEVESKGEMRSYTGIALSKLLAMIDGPGEEHPYTFDAEAWEAGYDVNATASDGYSVSFLSSDYDPDQIIVAYLLNGEPCTPILVGTELTRDMWVKDITVLRITVGGTDEVIPSLTISGAGTELLLSAGELKLTPYYIEERGGFTTSAGTYYESLYGGVRLYDLLASFGELSDEGTVTVIATDGYEMSYSVADLKDSSEGVWIVAFEENGEPMQLDPGYFRTVKVGDPVPNIDGHSSAKMVDRIEFSAEPLREFSLLINGRMQSEIDRSTMQSGINCTAHNTDVEYFNRKSGEVEHYTGIPLFLLLAYADDPDFAPHRQTDHNILSYDAEAAREGYRVQLTAVDGYSITLDSRELDGNLDVIIAMYQDDMELSDDDWPLKLVWDMNAAVVPEGIKAVRQIVRIDLLFD